MRKYFGLIAVVGVLAGFGAMSAESPAVKAAAMPVLVLAGASYTADWKSPVFPGYTLVNRGKGGDETSQVLARFDADVLAARPAAVLLWGHINNIHRAPKGQAAAVKQRVQSDYREMVARARRQGVIVLLATEVTLSEPGGVGNWFAGVIGSIRGKESYQQRINREVRELNAWLRDFARQEKLRLLDFEMVFDDGDGFRKREFTRDDGTHISVAGYEALNRYTQAQLAR